MKSRKKTHGWTLFRVLVVPSLFLCAIVKHPATQWIAVAALAVWVFAVAGPTFWRWVQSRSKKKSQSSETPAGKPIYESSATELAESDVFLIRQINYRITEMLKQNYPKVSWLWVKRPEVEEFRAGGTWKIQLSACEPYNFAEVTLAPTGKMDLTLLTAVALTAQMPEREKDPAGADPADLKEGEELERIDAQTWYSEYGSQRLAEIIDGLDPLGHKTLTIREDGEVVVKNGTKEVAVEKLEWMLPKIGWKDLCILFKDDDIDAKAGESSLVLSW